MFQEIQDIVEPDALLCSNTSTLPITGLAEGVTRQADFIGLHFFSPVDKMPLVEIIKGERTGDEALARAFDLVRQIKKTPIVVNDSRGFFTSRVIGQFINEGVAMVGEGIEPASIEQAAGQAGYPAKVLSLMDELTLTLPRKIRNETKRAVEEAGGVWPGHPSDAVIDRMVDEFGRTGRSGGAGFYEYGEDGKRGKLWPGLREHFAQAGARDPVRGHEGADALLGVPGHGPPLRGGRPHLGRRRQHRLDHGHRLPGLDRRRPPVHQRLRGRPARLRGPRPRARRALRRALPAAGAAGGEGGAGEKFKDA